MWQVYYKSVDGETMQYYSSLAPLRLSIKNQQVYSVLLYICGLQVLVYAAFSGLKLLVYAVLLRLLVA